MLRRTTKRFSNLTEQLRKWSHTALVNLRAEYKNQCWSNERHFSVPIPNRSGMYMNNFCNSVLISLYLAVNMNLLVTTRSGCSLKWWTNDAGTERVWFGSVLAPDSCPPAAGAILLNISLSAEMLDFFPSTSENCHVPRLQSTWASNYLTSP